MKLHLRLEYSSILAGKITFYKFISLNNRKYYTVCENNYNIHTLHSDIKLQCPLTKRACDQVGGDSVAGIPTRQLTTATQIIDYQLIMNFKIRVFAFER